MPESRPTIVFIPGAWHSVTSFDVLKAQLEAWSYSCTGADPPSVTSKHPLDVTLDTDVDFYRENVILPLLNDGKTIVLLQHSYGGVPGSGAVEGLSKREREKAGQKGGVLGLIFMTAVCLPVGQSIQDFIGLDDDFTPWTDVQKEQGTFTVPDPGTQFYNHLSKEEADRHAATLRPHATGTFKQKASYAAFADPAYHDKCAYIICEDDQSFALPVQQLCIQSSGITLTETLPTSHSPFLDMPDKVAEVVNEFVRAFENVDR